MSSWLKAAAPALLICGAFAKACVLLDANVAMLTISTIVCLALACYVYVTARNKQPTSALVVALSLVAIETLIYGMSVILQFAVIPPGAAYLVYHKIKMVYIGAWAVLRIAVTITMSPQSDQIYWQLAQVMLLFGLAIARFKKDKLTQPRRIFAIGFCVVVAAVLYGGVVLLPQRISIFLIATPITFLLASAISHLDNVEQNVADNDMMTWIDYFVVFAILCICFVYPFDAAASVVLLCQVSFVALCRVAPVPSTGCAGRSDVIARLLHGALAWRRQRGEARRDARVEWSCVSVHAVSPSGVADVGERGRQAHWTGERSVAGSRREGGSERRRQRARCDRYRHVSGGRSQTVITTSRDRAIHGPQAQLRHPVVVESTYDREK